MDLASPRWRWRRTTRGRWWPWRWRGLAAVSTTQRRRQWWRACFQATRARRWAWSALGPAWAFLWGRCRPAGARVGSSRCWVRPPGGGQCWSWAFWGLGGYEMLNVYAEG